MLDIDFDKAVYNFLKGSIKGVVKTMAKMGISTVASYRGAQIFEAIGLNTDLVNNISPERPAAAKARHRRSRRGGARRHRVAFPDRHIDAEAGARPGGVYQWRRTASTTSSTRKPSTSSKRPSAPAQLRAFQGIRRQGQRPEREPLHPARPDEVSSSNRKPSRSTRSSRSRPS
jgi:glutamate synthase domain-containing protein 2